VFDVTLSWASKSDSRDYSNPLRLDGTSTSISQAIVPGSVVRVTTNLQITGNEQDVLGLRCVLTSRRQNIEGPCKGEVRVPPGLYGLNIEGLPRDAYILSAGVADQDILSGEVSIQEDTDLSVVVKRPGASIEGIVRGPEGQKMPHATVALVPDTREVALRYRSVLSDIAGHFDLGGIAPGAYKLFAWQDLDGAAYRNTQFLEPFEQSGHGVRIQLNEHHSLELKVILAP
jgi:hypothetical protein